MWIVGSARIKKELNQPIVLIKCLKLHATEETDPSSKQSRSADINKALKSRSIRDHRKI